MKKRWMILFLLCALLVNGYAQNRPAVDERIEELKTKLNLSNEQAKDIILILNNDREQEKEQWTLNKGDQRAIRAAGKERKELTDRQIENILTPEQKTMYKAMRATESKYDDPQVMELVNRLNLSDEQAGKIENILLSARTEKQNTRSSTTNRRGRFEEIKKIQDNANKEIEEILTTEQKEAFKKYQAERDEEMRKTRGQRPGRGRNR